AEAEFVINILWQDKSYFKPAVINGGFSFEQSARLHFEFPDGARGVIPQGFQLYRFVKKRHRNSPIEILQCVRLHISYITFDFHGLHSAEGVAEFLNVYAVNFGCKNVLFRNGQSHGWVAEKEKLAAIG